jgi:hypothetical protein
LVDHGIGSHARSRDPCTRFKLHARYPGGRRERGARKPSSPLPKSEPQILRGVGGWSESNLVVLPLSCGGTYVDG